MVKLIPKRELKKLKNQFGIVDDTSTKDRSGQLGLFD